MPRDVFSSEIKGRRREMFSGAQRQKKQCCDRLFPSHLGEKSFLSSFIFYGVADFSCVPRLAGCPGWGRGLQGEGRGGGAGRGWPPAWVLDRLDATLLRIGRARVLYKWPAHPPRLSHRTFSDGKFRRLLQEKSTHILRISSAEINFGQGRTFGEYSTLLHDRSRIDCCKYEQKLYPRPWPPKKSTVRNDIETIS